MFGREQKATEATMAEAWQQACDLHETGKLEEALDAYGRFLNRFDAGATPEEQETVAMVLVNRAVCLHAVGRVQESVAASDEVVRRYVSSSNSRLREQAAMALDGKGVCLREQGRTDEALAAFEEGAQRFKNDPEAAVRAQVAKALCQKASLVGTIGRLDEAVDIANQVIQRYESDPYSKVQEQVDIALQNRLVALVDLDPNNGIEQAQSFLLEIISAEDMGSPSWWRRVQPQIKHRISTRANPGVHYQTAQMLEGIVKLLVEDSASVLAVLICDEIIRLCAEDTEPLVREKVAVALVSKGILHEEAEDFQSALGAYKEASTRFGWDKSPSTLRGAVINADQKRIGLLGRLGQTQDALLACDEALRRYGEASNLSTARASSWVLAEKCAYLLDSEQYVASLEACVEFEKRFFTDQFFPEGVSRYADFEQWERSEESLTKYFIFRALAVELRAKIISLRRLGRDSNARANNAMMEIMFGQQRDATVQAILQDASTNYG